MTNSWIHFLEKNAVEFKDKIAVIDQGSNREITYEQLNNEVNFWAAVLREHAVPSLGVVAFHAPTNSLHHLILMLACAKIKAMFVPLNFRLSNVEIEDVLKRITPSLYLGIGEKIFNVDTPYLDVSSVCLELNKYSNHDFLESAAGLDDTILMLFTSGSTGIPKGVMFHGGMLLSNQVETINGWGLRSSDVTLVETPFFHTGGYNVLCLPLLYLGGTVILAPSFDAENVFNCIRKYKVSVYFGVPTMFQMLLEKPGFNECDFSSIRFFISGGAACSISMIESYQKRNLVFKQGFGLTEVGPNCFLLDEEFAVSKAGSIGKAMPHSKVRLLTKDGRDADVNEAGELLLAGPHVCLGYYKNAAAFKDTFKDGYFYTGDLVRRDEDGFFFVVGRIKDMYISGGENVYPGEVEKQICSHPDISEAVVIGVPSEKWGEVGFAFLKTESLITIDGLRDFLNPLLSRYKHPHFINCLKEFPLLPNGKVDRKFLKAQALKVFIV
jgi:fatty-acyl-CoA synthase